MIITNTLTKQKEELVPRQNKKISMFVCGPTVYDYIHIGNARTFVFFDVVAKHLRNNGFEVNYIQNITDIDDKIIKKALEEKSEPLELAKEYENKFLEDMSGLGVNAVNKYARATDHIEQVIAQVKKLIEKKYAYLIENDGWYFDLKTFPEYGKLSGRTAEMADDAVSRIDENDKKRNKGDFCLWKFSKPDEPSWESDLGKGRPGWHIEDTAITEHYFGPQYDLHGGGQDLIFPHHEAEITQQESISGLKPFVKYWMHVAFLINKESKMSKSLGNFETVHELLKKYSPEALRFYLLSAHYRSPLDYGPELLNQSAAAVRRMKEFLNKLNLANADSEESIENEIKLAKEKFASAMDDDFNTSSAFASLFELISKVNPLLTQHKINHHDAGLVTKFINEIDQTLGIVPKKEEEIPREVSELVKKREELRQQKNWTEADKLRAQIKDLGYEIEDTTYGPFLLIS